jgi:hypothetical protein
MMVWLWLVRIMGWLSSSILMVGVLAPERVTERIHIESQLGVLIWFALEFLHERLPRGGGTK